MWFLIRLGAAGLIALFALMQVLLLENLRETITTGQASTDDLAVSQEPVLISLALAAGTLILVIVLALAPRKG